MNEMAGDAFTPASKSRSDNGRAVRRRVSKFTYSDKENFNVFGGNVGEHQKKSPLPVGYPRKPLNDITDVLRPLDDQSEEGSTRPRKPFTRSQNLGICTRNYDPVETSERTGGATGSSKKSKGKLNVQAATTGTVTTNSIRLTVSLDIHNQENRGPNNRSPSERKVKTVTFAEAESSGEKARHEVFLPKISIRSNDEPTFNALSTNSEMSEGGKVLANVRKENDTSAVAMNSTEESHHEVKFKSLSACSMAEEKINITQTPEADNDVKMEEDTVSSRICNQHTRQEKKYKALSSRSSVVKFR